MRTLRASSGPFTERPHYELREIERICVDCLREVDCLPKSPEPIRIDHFIEKRFKVVPTYEPLADGVLGFTQFGSKGPAAIVLSRELDEEATDVSRRRIRSTLAHEAGHILLQGHLFAFEPAPSLFGNSPDVSKEKILCRDGAGYAGRWWEFQANRAIGGLLLPRHLALGALEDLLVADGLLGARMLPVDRRREAEARLVDLFDVNGVVARVRLEELWPEDRSGQGRL